MVTEVGSEVTNVQRGDRVAYTGALGSYAEYAAVPASRLVKIPDELDFEQAAAAMLQGMTAHYLLAQHLQVAKRRDGVDTCGSGRRRVVAGPDGEEDRRSRDRDGRHTGESATRARRRRR